MMSETENYMDEAKDLADRVYSGMAQCVTGNGDWASALCIGQEMIHAALLKARNAALDEAASLVMENHNDPAVALYDKIRSLKEQQHG
jgi:hypothetical protein